MGVVNMTVPASADGEVVNKLQLQDALAVDKMDCNLFSISAWCDRDGREATFTPRRGRPDWRTGWCVLTRNAKATCTRCGRTLPTRSSDGGRPCEGKEESESAAISASVIQQFEAARQPHSPAMLHHLLCGHAGIGDIQSRVRAGTYVIKNNAERKAVLRATPTTLGCVACAMAKIHKKPVKKSVNNNQQARHAPADDDADDDEPDGADDDQKGHHDDLQQDTVIISTDICGPFPKADGTNNKYAIDFAVRVPGKKTRCYVFYAKTKAAAAAMVQTKYLGYISAVPAGAAVVLRSDRAREFDTPELSKFYDKHGIKRQRTSRGASWQNGAAERPWRTFEQDVVVLNFAAGLPASYWERAMRHAVNLRMRLAHATTDNPVYSDDLAVYGALAVAKKANQRGSLSLRGQCYIYLGVAADTKDAHALLGWDNLRVIEAERNVTTFNDIVPATLSPDLRQQYLDEEQEERAEEERREREAGTLPPLPQPKKAQDRRATDAYWSEEEWTSE